MDFPYGKGVVKEELLVTPTAALKKALDTLKPVVVDMRERNELTSDASDIVAAEGIKAICNIPLATRGRALGILSILRTKETPFSPGDVDFLSRASGQIAIAIENALAYHEISQLKDKLAQEKLYLEEEIRSEMNFENIIGNSPPVETCSGTRGNGRYQRLYSPAAGGDRYRQGVDRARHSRPQPAQGAHVCEAELCRHSYRSAGE